jgi:serine/threonine-protein kinase RsbT
MDERTVTVYITGESDVTSALVAAGDFAGRAGFRDRDKQAVVTVVAELSRNVVKYARSGRVVLTLIESADRRGIEVLVVDNGPGIADLELAMSDHFSTGKTLGLGLPGARRLMDEFSIDSTPGRGTRVLARKWL